MKRKKITLRDIAEKSGVSLMSVSRAIHGRPGIGKDLQKKIAEMAAEMGYVPNRSANQLGQKNSPMTVGVVIPHLANTIFPDILQSIETALSANGYRILLCCSYNNPIKEFQDISALLERQSDGIIWCPVLLEESRKAAELIRKQRCPLVFFGSQNSRFSGRRRRRGRLRRNARRRSTFDLARLFANRVSRPAPRILCRPRTEKRLSRGLGGVRNFPEGRLDAPHRIRHRLGTQRRGIAFEARSAGSDLLLQRPARDRSRTGTRGSTHIDSGSGRLDRFFRHDRIGNRERADHKRISGCSRSRQSRGGTSLEPNDQS